MNSTQNRFSTPTSEGSLWLEVTLETERHVFELAATDDRAIVVGSAPRAEVRVRAAGVAPIHCHFERENDVIWLIPDTTGALRLDTERVRRRRVISGRGCIDVAGKQLTIRVLHEPPTLADATLTTGTPVGIEYLSALPSDTDDTAAFGIFFPNAPVDAFPTTRGNAPIPSPEGKSATAYGPFGTEVVRIQDLLSAPVSMTANSLEPLSTGDTTDFEMPALTTPMEGARELAAPARAELVPEGSVPNATAGPSGQAAVVEKSSFLASVGLRAQRRPVAAGLATVIGGLVLALALASITHSLHLETSRAHSPVARTPLGALSRPPVSAVVPATHDGSSSSPSPSLPLVRPAPVTTALEMPSTAGHAPLNPDAAVAAGHLIAGRTAEAQRAYATLAARNEGNPALSALARLLARATDPRCTQATEVPRFCPEVKK